MPRVGWITYQTGTPDKTGVYACRVESVDGLPEPFDVEDKFLMWHDNRWWHIGSSQSFRPQVYGWIGPLERFR